MVKVLHTGDLHFDAQMLNLPPEKRGLRKKEQLDVLNRIISLAMAEGVQIVLIAGDLFESSNVSPETLDFVCDCFRQAKELRFVISPGNHDPYTPNSPYKLREWPDNVYIFTKPNIECVTFDDINTTVYGAAFTSPHCGVSLLADTKFEPFDGTRILLIHGDYNVAESDYNTILPVQLNSCDMDYVAMGHIHIRREIEYTENGRTAFSYCGTPEAHGYDELGDKGVYIGELENSKTTPNDSRSIVRSPSKFSFFKTGKRNFEGLTIELNPEMTSEDIIKEIKERGFFVDNIILRLVLTGEVSEQTAENIDTFVADLEREIRKGCFWGRVKSQVNTYVAPTTGAEFSLSSIFENKMQEAINIAIAEGKDDVEVLRLRRALELGRKSLEGRSLTNV